MKIIAKGILLISSLVVLPFAKAELSIDNKEYTPLSQVKWKNRPAIFVNNEDCLSKSQLEFIAELKVGTQGELKTIRLLKGSGKSRIDKRLLKQLKTAEFYPFIKNGELVESLVRLPIRITCV